MVIAEVTISPVGTGTPSISRYVAACHKVLLKHTDIKHQLTSMSTILEGELDKVLAVIREMHEVPFTEGVERVSTLIRIDDRRDKDASMDKKVRAVEEKL